MGRKYLFVVGAGLLIKSVTNLGNIDYEFATENMFTGLVTLPEAEEITMIPAEIASLVQIRIVWIRHVRNPR